MGQGQNEPPPTNEWRLPALLLSQSLPLALSLVDGLQRGRQLGCLGIERGILVDAQSAPLTETLGRVPG